MLGVDDRAGEALGPLELRRVALVVAVVAGAGPEVAAGQLHRLTAAGAFGLDGPARVRRRPLGPHDLEAVADLPLDPVLARGLAHVVEDLVAVGDRLHVGPRLEAIAQRVHVGVRADPGVAEEVPGPAQVLARLEDRVALAGAALVEVVGGADPGDSGADDQHVEMLDGLPVRAQACGHSGRLAGQPVPMCGSHTPQAGAGPDGGAGGAGGVGGASGLAPRP